jgi:hypothetical protein
MYPSLDLDVFGMTLDKISASELSSTGLSEGVCMETMEKGPREPNKIQGSVGQFVFDC